MFSPNNKPYFIAEVGANHQGSVETACDYIEAFARNGASAIKFQMRDNRFLFSPKAYDTPYNSENSFGSTYGQHRDFLELSKTDYQLLKQKCLTAGVDFAVTAFDERSLDILFELDVDLIKIASFDCGNIPFLSRINGCNARVVLSTGSCDFDEIDASVDALSDCELSVLHCVSQYPCPVNELQLANIESLRNRYGSRCSIGLSCHSNGILSGAIARQLGATVFEKHVTFDRSWKGTDHAFALTPHGFYQFQRDIKRVDEMIGSVDRSSFGTQNVYAKLGKSLAALVDINAGEVLSCQNLFGRIGVDEGDIPIKSVGKFLGRTVRKDVKAGSFIYEGDLND